MMIYSGVLLFVGLSVLGVLIVGDLAVSPLKFDKDKNKLIRSVRIGMAQMF